MLRYRMLTSTEDLMLHYDDILEGMKIMVRRNSQLTTTEHLMRMILTSVGKPNCFLMVAYDHNEFVGVLFALSVGSFKSWVEICALYCKPGYFKSLKNDGWDSLKKWAKFVGAGYILTCITRQPKAFYKFFYGPLGFEQTGIILEAKL